MAADLSSPNPAPANLSPSNVSPTRKGPDAFRTISEASDELGVPQHVLRFWETKFAFIRPMKRAGGRRFYRRQDLEVLAGVRTLLHREGYTIKGVQRLHKEQGMRRLMAAAGGDIDPAVAEALDADAAAPSALDAETRARLEDTLVELAAAKALIDTLLASARPTPKS
jgi:DNA-binding transcriptional MerR regulator